MRTGEGQAGVRKAGEGSGPGARRGRFSLRRGSLKSKAAQMSGRMGLERSDGQLSQEET